MHATAKCFPGTRPSVMKPHHHTQQITVKNDLDVYIFFIQQKCAEKIKWHLIDRTVEANNYEAVWWAHLSVEEF